MNRHIEKLLESKKKTCIELLKNIPKYHLAINDMVDLNEKLIDMVESAYKDENDVKSKYIRRYIALCKDADEKTRLGNCIVMETLVNENKDYFGDEYKEYKEYNNLMVLTYMSKTLHVSTHCLEYIDQMEKRYDLLSEEHKDNLPYLYWNIYCCHEKLGSDNKILCYYVQKALDYYIDRGYTEEIPDCDEILSKYK